MFQPSNLGPLEQQVVSVVWNTTNQPATVSSVVASLQQQNKTLAYTTVMTILNRLVEKGYLVRVKHGRSYSYQAHQQSQSFLKQLIRSTIASFARTFGEEAIIAFAQEANHLSKTQKKQLQKKLVS